MPDNTPAVPEFTREHYVEAKRALTPWSGRERWPLVFATGLLGVICVACFLIGSAEGVPAIWRVVAAVAGVASFGTSFAVGTAASAVAVERALRSGKCASLRDYWHRAVIAAYGSRDVARALLPIHVQAQSRHAAREHRGNQWRVPALVTAAFGTVILGWYGKVAAHGFAVLAFYSLLLLLASLVAAGVGAIVRDVLSSRYSDSLAILELLRDSASHIASEDAHAAVRGQAPDGPNKSE